MKIVKVILTKDWQKTKSRMCKKGSIIGVPDKELKDFLKRVPGAVPVSEFVEAQKEKKDSKPDKK